MIEIEAKYKVKDGITRDELLKRLDPLFTAPVAQQRQIDTIFHLPEQTGKPIVPGSKIMRVRDSVDPETGDRIKSLMTLKVEGKVKLASQEYEFAVDSGDDARAMLRALGWRHIVTVDKVRTESKIGEYGVCIDEVAGVGLFIELEALAEEGADVAAVQRGMQTFLEKLDIKGEPWHIPYDTTVLQYTP